MYISQPSPAKQQHKLTGGTTQALLGLKNRNPDGLFSYSRFEHFKVEHVFGAIVFLSRSLIKQYIIAKLYGGIKIYIFSVNFVFGITVFFA